MSVNSSITETKVIFHRHDQILRRRGATTIMSEKTTGGDPNGSPEETSDRSCMVRRHDRFLGVDETGSPMIDWVGDWQDESAETSRGRGQWERSPRSPTQRDRDRILYTQHFRRLKNVTQVARAGEAYLYHDRLSHSLKVAQVGRSLAELFLDRQETIQGNDTRPPEQDEEGSEDGFVVKRLCDLDKRLDPNVVETAALAHDMGHPPFGHRIEDTLDDLVDEYKDGLPSEPDDSENDSEEGSGERDDIPFGYEGNAQSLRIVAKLAQSGPESVRTEDYAKSALEGLHLTRASLNAIIKYPRSPAEDEEKYGYYPRTETEVFDFARELGPDGEKTIEAAIMDYADDVTFAIHDMTDFYKDGRLPLQTLLNEAFEFRQVVSDQNNELTYDNYTTDQNDRSSELPNTPEIDRVVKYLTNLDESDQEINEIPSPPEIIEIIVELGEMWPERLNQNAMTPFRRTPSEQKNLDFFISELIKRYLDSNEVWYPKVALQKRTDSDGGDAVGYELKLEDGVELQVWLLRKLTEFYVIGDTALMGQQRGEEQVIRELYDALYKESIDNSDNLSFSAIAEPYCTWLEDWEKPDEMSDEMYRARVIADIIASLTERQAIRLYGRLTGETPGSIRDPIV